MKTIFRTIYAAVIAMLALCAALVLSGCGTSAGVASAASAEPESGSAVADSAQTVETEPVAAEISEEEPEAAANSAADSGEDAAVSDETSAVEEASAEESAPAEEAEERESQEQIVTVANVTSTGIIDATDLFSDRDLTQTPDLSGAVRYTVSDGEDIHVTEEGVYVLSGSAEEVTVYVEADDQAKVQLVLDELAVTNTDFPCVYVTSADKVFVTTTESENTLSVTGTFRADGDTNTDGVIFSREDVVLNGLGTLNINSTDNGVVSKDDLKITGGVYNIDAASKSLEANDSIRVADGELHLKAGTDCLHAENEEDDALGYIYICGGTFELEAGDDAIHAVSALQIDGGSFTISGAEGLEGTYIQINDGTIVIDSWDDGINAAWKSNSYPVTLEINGGELTVVMASGDTDGIDSNGDLIITGGTIDVTGRSTFDCDGTVTFTGGTIYVNGTQVDTIPTQMMGGRGGRGWGG